MKRYLFSIAIVISALVSAFAQEGASVFSARPIAVPPQGEELEKALSLTDCIQIGLQHNLDVQINRISPQVSKYNYSMAYGAYDPTFTASYTYRFNRSQGVTDPTVSTVTRTGDFYGDAVSSGLSMLTPFGGNVRLNGSYSRSGRSSEIYGYGNDDNFSSSGSMSISQPLLKNAWIDSTRLQIRTSRNSLQSTRHAYEYSLMGTILAIENAYYGLIGAKEEIYASEQNLSQAQEFLEETRKKVELGSLIELDTKDAESRVSNAKTALIAAKKAYNEATNTLRSLLSDDFTLWQDTELDLTDELLAQPMLPSRAESWFKGLKMRPDLLQMQIDLENRNIYVKYSYNQLFPQLDVIGSYGSSASRYNDTLTPPSQMLRGIYPEYTVGGQLTVPVLNISARNTYKIRKAEREQAILKLKQKEQDVMIEIDNAINNINSSLEAITSTREATKYAREAWEAGKIRLEHGKATSFEVLELQTTLFQRKLTEINALVAYNQNLARLRYCEGSTLENYNITVTYE